jgi:ATP-dependent protease HslVU (ClpYQ) peptidase subunit
VTVIAANRRCMSADHRMTFGEGTPKCHAVKIFRIGDNIVGAAGSCGATTQFYEWMRRDCPPMENPSLPTEGDGEEDDGFIGLVLNEDGLFLYTGMCDPDKLMDDCYAIGTGSAYAVEAMLQGKSPKAAVLRACESTETCGLYKDTPPTVLDVKPKQTRTKLKHQKPTPEEPPVQPTGSVSENAAA